MQTEYLTMGVRVEGERPRISDHTRTLVLHYPMDSVLCTSECTHVRLVSVDQLSTTHNLPCQCGPSQQDVSCARCVMQILTLPLRMFLLSLALNQQLVG